MEKLHANIVGCAFANNSKCEVAQGSRAIFFPKFKNILSRGTMKTKTIITALLLCLCATNAMAYEYHNQTTKVKHFDWSQFYFTYTDIDGVEHTACLTDEALTPEHQMALLREVYKNPNIPGIHYAYDYNGTQNRKINYNQYGHSGRNNDPTGYWVGDVDEIYPDPYEDGMTMLLVQVKDTWKTNDHNKYTGRAYFEKAVESIKLMPNFVRVESAENPGYLFSINDATNRFFFISKGKPRSKWTKPFYRLYEQISPVNDISVDIDAESLIDALRAGNDYYCFHDCSNAFSLTSVNPVTGKSDIPHWFTISNKGESFNLTNLTIFIPDRRFEYELAPASYSDVNSNQWTDSSGGKHDYFNEYGNSQNPGEEQFDVMPKMLIYSADLEAQATPSETRGYFDVQLDWSSALTGMDVPEHYYVYQVDPVTHSLSLLPTLNEQPTTLRSNSFPVQQELDPQEFYYMVTASPIIFNDDGTICCDGEGNPVQTIMASSRIRSVVIPGTDPYFSKATDFRSRYEIDKEINVYKNKVTVVPTTPDDYASIKNNQNNFTLTRTDDAGNSETVATIRFTQLPDLSGYNYTVTYNYASQDTINLFDDEQPSLAGTFTNFDGAHVTVIDRFSASTLTNSQPGGYSYVFEQEGERFSNVLPVPIYKTTNNVQGVGVTQEECDNDDDHSLTTDLFTAVTFNAMNNPFANLTEYSVKSVKNSSVNKVGKAENSKNDGVYSKFGTNGDNLLNEYQGTDTISTNGGNISINVRLTGNEKTYRQVKYVPVVVTSYDNKKMEYNTYGCSMQNVEFPSVNAYKKQSMMTKPLNSWQGLCRFYMMQAEIAPSLPAGYSKDNIYRIRVWRVNGDSAQGYFTYLGYETLLNDLESVSGQSVDEDGTIVNWGSDYTTFQGTWPTITWGKNKNKCLFTDLWLDKAIVSETDRKTVKYIVRMYATPNLPGSGSSAPRPLSVADDHDHFISEWTFSVVYTVNGTITGMDELVADNDVESITYYNMLGMASKEPFKGVNIVATRYTNGRLETTKRLFP